MIKIFEADAKKFDTNGLKVIFPDSCIEYKKESLNGWYIEAEVSIKYKPYIIKDNIMLAKTKSKLRPQAFRIKKIEEHTSNIIVMAEHIMFDAENYFLEDVRPTNLSAANALNYINERTDIKSPFSFFSDVTKISTQYIIDKNLLEAMSLIEERWGGKFDADNYDIFFRQNLGNNNGEIIRQKKNLISRVISEDWSNVVTKLYPQGPDDLKLPEKFIKSDIQYKIPYTKCITFDFDTDEEISEEEKIKLLRELAKKYLEENKYPQVCYELEADLQNVEIGDQVQVIDNSLNLITSILEYEYDLNTKKIRSIIFGNYTKNAREKFNNIKEAILETINTVSKQQLVINRQTEIINNLNKNGIVKITDNEILILDKIPLEEAKNVWRFGLGGLAFSSNGYEGPFETAITIDGQINAKFITSGQMSTERIEGFEQLLLTIESAKEKTTQLQLDVDSIKGTISEVADMTTSAQNVGSVTLENINNSEPIMLIIHPTTEDLSYLYLQDDLYLSDDLYLLSRTIRFKNDKGYVFDYELPDDLLICDGVYDEFSLDYNSGECIVTKRIGVDANGNNYVLPQAIIRRYDYPSIVLEEGNYTVSVLSFDSAYIFCRLMTKNIYTDQFVPKIEFNTAITQTKEMIKEEANLKVGKDVFEAYQKLTAKEFEVRVKENEIIASINLSSEAATINASKINLKASDIINLLANNTINMTANNIIFSSTNFSVNKDGYLTAKSGNIGGISLGSIGLYFNNNTTGWGLWGTTANSNVVFHAGSNSSNISKAPFRILHDGTFYATKANITGAITATSGSFTGTINAKNGNIGGLIIGTDTVYSGDCGFSSNTSKWAFWAGESNGVHGAANTNAKFKVGHNGILDATNARINGTISSSTIKGSSIIGGSIKIESTGYFSFGTGVSTHPWASAINVTGLYGINFFSGNTVNSVGSQQGFIDMGGSNGALRVQSLYTDVILSGYHIKLNPGTNGTAYVVKGNTHYVISTNNGNVSSLNLKKNLRIFDNEEYEKAYQLLKKIDMYRFDYKYKISENKKEYGFVIDYIEKNKDFDQFLYFKNEKAKARENEELDYLVERNDKNVIDFKKYDTENLIKYLMTILKAMQIKIENLESR